MNIALISTVQEDPQTHVPIGLLPLFDGNILDAQVRIVRDLGAEKIIFLSNVMHGALLQYTDALKNTDIAVEIARSASDLAGFASDEDKLLFLGDGILPNSDLAAQLTFESPEKILVAGNADENSGYELIDLNHRWLGLALLNASRLSSLGDIPDDWDSGSALLRTAVQAQCTRVLISDRDINTGSVNSLQNGPVAESFVARKLKEFKPKNPSFLDKFIVWPLTRKILPALWKKPELTSYLSSGILALGFASIPFAYFGFLLTALSVLLLGSLGLKITSAVGIFSSGLKLNWRNVAFSVFAFLSLLIGIVQQSVPSALVPNVLIALILAGLLALSQSSSNAIRSNLLKPDNILTILLLLTFSIGGNFVFGTYAAAAFSMIYLLTTLQSALSADETPGK